MNDEKKWKMLQQALSAGMHGDEMAPVVSKRTLFGIRSSIEEQMDAIAKEVQEKRDAERRAAETHSKNKGV